MSPRGELTPTQRAALIAWHLAQGKGLSIGQIRTLGKYYRQYKTRRVLTAIANVMDIRHDGDTWAAFYGSVTTSPHTSQERAALIAYDLARYGEVSSAAIGKRFGISRQAVFDLLCMLSLVLPIYQAAPGVWQVLDFKELEN